MDRQADRRLREEIRDKVPYGNEWLRTPHEMLGGQSPEQRLEVGDLDSVRRLVDLILYIGIS